jgi:hypothetical protein
MATAKNDSQSEAAAADHNEAEALHALLTSAKARITVNDEYRHLVKFRPDGSIDFDDIRTRLLAARVCAFADVGDTPFPAAIDLLKAWETEAEQLARVEQLLSKTSSPKTPCHRHRAKDPELQKLEKMVWEDRSKDGLSQFQICKRLDLLNVPPRPAWGCRTWVDAFYKHAGRVRPWLTKAQKNEQARRDKRKTHHTITL